MLLSNKKFHGIVVKHTPSNLKVYGLILAHGGAVFLVLLYVFTRVFTYKLQAKTRVQYTRCTREMELTESLSLTRD